MRHKRISQNRSAAVVGTEKFQKLRRRTLRSPGEVTGLKTEGTELVVTATDADKVDVLGANLGVGGLTAKLELSLLAHGNLLTTGKTALVGRVSRDT